MLGACRFACCGEALRADAEAGQRRVATMGIALWGRGNGGSKAQRDKAQGEAIGSGVEGLSVMLKFEWAPELILHPCGWA